MSKRAEARAEEYIKKSGDNGMTYADYTAGYEQAEKDLALTWQDIAKIVTLADTILDRNPEVWKIRGPEAYYSEVLRIFNENKQE